MIYTYPRPQSVFKETVFLIEETVKSGKFDEYHIPYKKGDGIKIHMITHKFLLEAIEKGIVKKLEKPGAFNDKPYYRIPLEIQLTLF